MAMLALLLLLAAPREARAQGAEVLPDPITTRELIRYMDMLNLDDAQRAAAEAEHEAYKERFKAFRESDIEDFQKELRKMSGRGMQIPSSDQIEKLVKQRDRIFSRITALDNGMFDAISTTLSEQTAARLPRVRMARERQRFMGGGLGEIGMGSDIDLSIIARDTIVKLTDEQLTLIDEPLASYETRLTRTVETFHKNIVNMFVNIFKRLEELGFNEDSMRDPQQMGRMFQEMQAAWEELSVEMLESADDIRQLNRKTARSLSSLLPAEEGLRFKRRFFEEAYRRELGHEAQTISKQAHAEFDKAARLTGISSETRAGVRAAGGQYAAADDQLMEKLASLIDESQKQISPFGFGRDEPFEDEQDELRQKRYDLAENARATLHAMLGPDASERLKRPGDEETIDAEMRDRIAELTGEGGAQAAQPNDEIAQMITEEYESDRESRMLKRIAPPGPDPYIPAPISAAELKQYARILELDDEGRSMLDLVHADYMESHEVVQRTSVEPALKAIGGQWARNDQGQPAVTAADIDQNYALRKAAFTAMQQLDKTFFGDVELVAAPGKEDAMRRVRLTRAWVQYAGRRGAGDFSWGATDELKINPFELVDSIGISGDDGSRANAVLLARESEIMSTLQSVFETSFAAARESNKFQIAFSWDFEREGVDMNDEEEMAHRIAQGMEWQEKLAEYGKPQREALKQLAQLNRSLVDDVAAQLSRRSASRIHNAYNGAAFPNAYQDRRALGPGFRVVNRLHDLTPEQRDKITAIADAYREKYNDITRQMIEVYRESDFAMAGFSMDSGSEWQKLQSRLSSVRFERDELNQATIEKMKRALTAAQLARFPMLKALEEE